MPESLYDFFIRALGALFLSWVCICTWHEFKTALKPKNQPEEESEK